ncbi:MAG: F0F1 ATP synthase subunit A [Saprospiraceae bacterium]|nr:F0F1 ATP synthase subunit A [Saprospiraceae bacterium]
MTKRNFILLFFALSLAFTLAAQHESQTPQAEIKDTTSLHQEHPVAAEAAGHEAAAEGHGHAEYDPAGTAIHHISDANVYSILDFVRIPLPMILYAPDKGWDMFLSNKFHPGHHEDGHAAYNGYVMHHGSVYRIADPSFQQSEAEVEGFEHKIEERDGKPIDVYFAKINGQDLRLDPRTTLDGGVLGGGITSFYDFSITKNVMSMLLVSLLLLFFFTRAARAYKTNPDKSPKGVQNVLETMFMYIRDEVAIPFIGKDKYMKYLPLLMSIFFFVLGLNLFGQVPFLGSVNVTGNLSVTMIIALVVFVIVNINGNKHYWAHIFWMPGVPVPVKILLAGVEFMSLFIKPLTLTLRLAGNISAGHIAILSFIGLIFIFGKSGESLSGGAIGTAMAIPLTLFMMAIELIVAFVQAFVFTILTASYIGAAIEDAHHGGDHAHAAH